MTRIYKFIIKIHTNYNYINLEISNEKIKIDFA